MAKRKRRNSAFNDERELIAYVRQSRSRPGEQESTSLSLDAQAEHIKRWGDSNGYRFQGIVRDHDEDSETDQRDGLKELLTKVKPGVTVGVELWDRIGRGWIAESIVAEIERRGGRAVSVTQGSDRLSRGLYAVIGKEYLVQLSERLSAVTAQRVQRGIHVGETPYGYDRPGRLEYLDKHGEWKTRHTGSLTVDPETATVVERIFAGHLAGDPLRQIANTLERDKVTGPSGNGWVPQTIRWILTNPIYAGAVRANGTVVWNAAHEPIVSRDTWEQAQLRFDRAVTVKHKDPGHWCDGLLFHSCGCRMSLNMVSRANGTRYPSYRCGNANRIDSRKCRQPRQHIGVPLLERAVRSCLIADLSGVVDTRSALHRAAQRVSAPSTEAERKRLTDLRTQKNDERAQARQSYIEQIDSLEVWRASAALYDRQIAEIGAELARLPESPDVIRYQTAAKSLRSIAEIVEEADKDVWRELVTTLGRIVLDERGVHMSYWEPINDFIVTPTIFEPRRPLS